MFWVKTQSSSGTKEGIPQKEKTFFLHRWRRWSSGYRMQRKVCCMFMSIDVTTWVARNIITLKVFHLKGRQCGIMVRALNLGLSSGQGHCSVFLGKTLFFHSASPTQVNKCIPVNLMPGVTLWWTCDGGRGGSGNTPSCFVLQGCSLTWCATLLECKQCIKWIIVLMMYNSNGGINCFNKFSEDLHIWESLPLVL